MNTPADDEPITELPLRGLRIGLSGAIPERETWTVPDLDRAILRFIAQFAGLVFQYGGGIVHGSHPSFTPVLLAEAKNLGISDAEKQLTLVRANAFPEPGTSSARRIAGSANTVQAILQLGPMQFEGPLFRKLSLTAMRLVLVNQIDVLVAVGGRLHTQEHGRASGVTEELTLAHIHDVPCFPVAAFGGSTQQLSQDLLQRFCGQNRMSPSELADLANPEYMDFAAGRLVAHLAKHREHWINARKSRSVAQNAKGAAINSAYAELPLFDARVEVLPQVALTVQTQLDRIRNLTVGGTGSFVFGEVREKLAAAALDEVKAVDIDDTALRGLEI
jgi:hypothetical protein